VFLDFAHAPSKVKATMDSIQEQFPEQKWIAVAELHTYSSLNVKFLPHYAHALDRADNACVFYSPHAVKMKKMEPMEAEDIRKGFQRSDLSIATNKEELRDFLQPYIHKGYSLLLMSSGTFGGTNVRDLAKEFLGL
jgi:UDP-N-acetylmuramate: L-alanyl-gamma-D-glutamyl-meso-diaminopimelate ligase